MPADGTNISRDFHALSANYTLVYFVVPARTVTYASILRSVHSPLAIRREKKSIRIISGRDDIFSIERFIILSGTSAGDWIVHNEKKKNKQTNHR